jgi:hypothetical protein
VVGLPRESTFVRKVSPAAEWSSTEYLLAALIEVVDAGNRWMVQLNTKRGSRQPDPVRIERPGAPKPKSRGVTVRQMFGRSSTKGR